MSTITKINVGGIDYDIGGSGSGTRVVTAGNSHSLQVNSPGQVGDLPCGDGAVDLQFSRTSEDKTAKGDYSFVAGFNNKALGEGSVCFGKSNIAMTDFSIATGNNCIASLDGAVVNNNYKNWNDYTISKYGGCGFKGLRTSSYGTVLFKLSNADRLVARIDVIVGGSSFSSYFIEVENCDIVYQEEYAGTGSSGSDSGGYSIDMRDGKLVVWCNSSNGLQLGIFYTLYKATSANSSSSSSGSSSSSSGS